jgi:hypothetical protein
MIQALLPQSARRYIGFIILISLERAAKKAILFLFTFLFSLSKFTSTPVFGRYCSASARCTWVIASDPAKSAIVRLSFQHPVIGPRRQLQLAHGGLHQGLAGVIQNTIFADLGRVHVGVAGNVCSRKAFSLVFTRGLHPYPHLSRGLPRSHVAQLLQIPPAAPACGCRCGPSADRRCASGSASPWWKNRCTAGSGRQSSHTGRGVVTSNPASAGTAAPPPGAPG